MMTYNSATAWQSRNRSWKQYPVAKKIRIKIIKIIVSPQPPWVVEEMGVPVKVAADGRRGQTIEVEQGMYTRPSIHPGAYQNENLNQK